MPKTYATKGNSTGLNTTVTTQNVGNSTVLDTFLTNLDVSQTGEADSGFGDWTSGADASTYTISAGNFTVDRAGYVYKNGKKITFAASQSVGTIATNDTSYIYIDTSGILQITTSAATAYSSGVPLFEVLFDGTNYVTVRENHPYSFDSQVSSYLHSAIGTIIQGTGAIVERVANGTGASADDRRIKITGADTLSDHGISTTISAINPAVWNIYYKNGSSKWTLHAQQSELPMKYNNAGTVADLAITTTIYSVYTLYASKDDIESSTPSYFATLSGAYATSADALAAITAGTTAVADNELSELELAQLGTGIMMYSATGGYLFQVTSSKSTLRQTFSSGVSSGDHGALSGLADDDHTQYELAAGSGVDNAIGRIDGTSGRQLQTSLATIDDTGSINIPTGQSYKINAAAITTANVADSSNKRYVNDAQLVVIGNTSGTNSGDNAANTSIVATKLDDFATPDNNTDLNANTTNHGLLLIATAPAAGLTNVVAIENGETAYKNKELFDATAPTTQAFDDAAVVGTATTSARRDHKHAMMAAPTTVSGNAGTVTVAAETGDTSCSVLFATDVSGSLSPKTNTNLTFNASTGVLTSASSVLTTTDINGGTIDNTTIGVSTATTGKFTTVETTGNIELGASTDTTLSRVSAGVVAIEGSNIMTLGSTDTITGVKTHNADIVMGDAKQIKLTVPSADVTCTGFSTSSFVSGYTSSAVGDLVYLDANAKWQKTDSDAIATSGGMIGIALAVAAADASLLVALPGSFVRVNAWNWTVGQTLYVSETAGGIATAIPTGADGVIRVIGWACNADYIYFYPSSDNSTTVA